MRSKKSRCYHLLIPDGGSLGLFLSPSRSAVHLSPPCCASPPCPLSPSSWGQGRGGKEGREGLWAFLSPVSSPLCKCRLLSGSPLCRVLVTAPDPPPSRCSSSWNPWGIALYLVISPHLALSFAIQFLFVLFLIQVFAISLQFKIFLNYTI